MVALSDDSGLEIKSLEINPVSTQQGGQKNMEVFNNAMKKILKLLRKKK